MCVPEANYSSLFESQMNAFSAPRYINSFAKKKNTFFFFPNAIFMSAAVTVHSAVQAALQEGMTHDKCET